MRRLSAAARQAAARRTRMWRASLAVWLALPALAAVQNAPSAPASRPSGGVQPVILAGEVDAIIHPVTAEYMTEVMDRADASGAELVLFTLRTPGGLVDSTRTIVSRLVASKTPVVVYIAPSGTRAASAGFLLAIAADVVAMAPGTSLGAAHPVSAGGGETNEIVAKKAESDVAAYARSLAAKRGRNVTLAEEAVVKSRAFTEEEALEATPPLIDLIAKDRADLVARLDGRTITRFDGSTTTLRTKEARIEEVRWTWRQKILSGIAHPQVAYLLFTLGTLGLTIELWNPGAILPGVVGGLALLLSLYAFQVLPVNEAGLLLMLFGIALLILEVKVTSFGMLAIGGIASLLFGSLMLYDTDVPALRVGLSVILPTVGAMSAILLFLVRLAVQAQRRRSETGDAGMLGEVGRAVGPIGPGSPGRVFVHGEYWNAVSQEPIESGDPVEIVGLEGLTVHVRRAHAARPQEERTTS